MPTKKQIQPGEKVPLKLTATERKLVLENVTCLDSKYEKIIRDTPSGKLLMMTLDDLDDFGGFIAAEANHCDDMKKQNKLDKVIEKVQRLLDTYTFDEPPRTLTIEDARKDNVISDQATAQKNTDVLYQFRITLLDSKPSIWRRIQLQDCTLDTLHAHIQTAMGWTNSHLHQFEIKGERYGDPELLDDGFDDFDCEDSTNTMLSEILPKTGKRFAFKYEYDFGDGWEHEILYEGSPPLEKGKKYPLCLEGERACPPEDVGGVWGYTEFLEAISDPEHEQHDEFVKWAGEYDPDDFDPERATRDMKKGLPDWRRM